MSSTGRAPLAQLVNDCSGGAGYDAKKCPSLPCLAYLSLSVSHQYSWSTVGLTDLPSHHSGLVLSIRSACSMVWCSGCQSNGGIDLHLVLFRYQGTKM